MTDHNFTHGLKFALSRVKPDVGDKTRQRMDGAFFWADEAPTDGSPNWPDQVVSVEFKKEATKYDPFHDNPDGTIVASDSMTRIHVFGQVLSYAEHIHSIQHRTGHFTILVMGGFFRAVYWDRSGILVTPRTSYVDHPHHLCELLRRISLTSKDHLGFDPYALRLHPGDQDYRDMDDAASAQPDDVSLFSEVVPPTPPAGTSEPQNVHDMTPTFTVVRDMFAKSLEDPFWPRYKLCIPGEGSEAPTREFLVGKPTFVARGLIGRGTRGYVALECGTNRFVFLKDAWRTDYRGLTREGDVLAMLNDASDNKRRVENVPTLVCHADISDQTTKSPRIWEELQVADHGVRSGVKDGESGLTVNMSSDGLPDQQIRLARAIHLGSIDIIG